MAVAEWRPSCEKPIDWLIKINAAPPQRINLWQTEYVSGSGATGCFSSCTDPGWLLVEDGVDPAREREIEALFAIGNGYLSARASRSLPKRTRGPHRSKMAYWK